MTKVRVCVGVHGGFAFAYGDSLMDDKGLEKTMLNEYNVNYRPEVIVSFHDLEVESPQAPVVEALSLEGHTLKRGDLVEWSGIGCRKWRVQRLGNNNTAYITAADLPEVAESTTWKGLEVLFPDGVAQKYAAVAPRRTKLIALAGQWHIADGEVVLSPPPQPEPEVKTKFQFGDLVKMSCSLEQYVVAHPSRRGFGDAGVSLVWPKYFERLSGPAYFEEMVDLLGYSSYSPNGEVDGTSPDDLTLIAPAGQWHINSSGEVVLKPKPEVPKPKFKRGDKVTRMQLGRLETWQAVEPVPDADGMIVLLRDGLYLPWFYSWKQLVLYFGRSQCGSNYRMSYEDDCILVPEVTSPQGLKPGDMVVDQNNELWDVDEISDKYVGFVWLSSKNLVGRRLGSAHDLKKVVFGTL